MRLVTSDSYSCYHWSLCLALRTAPIKIKSSQFCILNHHGCIAQNFPLYPVQLELDLQTDCPLMIFKEHTPYLSSPHPLFEVDSSRRHCLFLPSITMCLDMVLTPFRSLNIPLEILLFIFLGLCDLPCCLVSFLVTIIPPISSVLSCGVHIFGSLFSSLSQLLLLNGKF